MKAKESQGTARVKPYRPCLTDIPWQEGFPNASLNIFEMVDGWLVGLLNSQLVSSAVRSHFVDAFFQNGEK